MQLPSAMAFGAARNPAATEAAWKAAGGNLAALGINVDFAPVADVLGPRGSGVIGSRSYGSVPADVSVQVVAATKGLTAAGVAPALKHFPGHGHTTADSHEELPVLAQDRAALDRDDLPPFVAGIQAGAGIVMSGHLDVKAIDPGTPATFSSKVLIDLLRGQLGFKGVVVSDAMNMAPAKKWGPGEAAKRAVLAGNDLVLMPPNLKQAQKGLLDGLKDGSLPKQRLVEAATRVLTLRYRLAATPQPAMSTLDSEADRAAAQAPSAAAVTVFRGRCSGPLVSGGVTIAADGKWGTQKEWLTAALAEQGIQVRSGGTTVRLIGYDDGAASSSSKDVTVAMDTPYALRQMQGTLVATYSSSQASMKAVAAVLAGKAKAPGRSPVKLDGLPAVRLRADPCLQRDVAVGAPRRPGRSARASARRLRVSLGLHDGVYHADLQGPVTPPASWSCSSTSWARSASRSSGGVAASRLRCRMFTAALAPITAISAFGHANTAVAPSAREFIAMYAPP